mgnify:CR=1 FL=1
MNILIPIEISSRELYYKVYLSKKLSELGFNCFLGRKAYIDFLINELRNFIYLDKGYHKKNSDDLYKRIKKNKGLIISLDEEGVLDFRKSEVLKGRYSDELFKIADLIFFWGEKQKKTFCRSHDQKKKSIVSGHPRFQMLKPDYQNLYYKEVLKIKNKHKSFILVNTNMGVGNNIKGDDFVRQNYKDRINKIDDLILNDKLKLKSYIDMISELSKVIDNKIILRPHPEEDLATYLKSFVKLKNVDVIYDGSVIPWILASDIMIHPDCSTAIESLFIGKKPLSYLPINHNKDFMIDIPLMASRCFDQKEDIINFIVNKKKNQSFDHELEQYFSFKKDSTKIITKNILKVAKKNNLHLFNNNLTIRQRIILKAKSIKMKLMSFVSNNELMDNKLKGFKKENILKIVNDLKKSEIKYNSSNIKSINTQLFLFKKMK